MSTQRTLTDPLIRRGTRAEALVELERLKPAARRMGYGLEVRGTMRRHGRDWYEERPYGVYLTMSPERAQERPEQPEGDQDTRGASKGLRRPLRAV